ncbi:MULTISPECIES: serine/threonine protein kinase [unclassified Paenibacillus]|uniref:serine/threonine protein kinase n=1 Tax=unclassified Paenibacillus TaxID=185978 RepID=UPI00362D27F7
MKTNDNPLLHVQRIEGDIVSFLSESGTIFKEFNKQDSGCISYGVHSEGQNWFVKYAEDSEAVRYLKNAHAFNQQVEHPRLPKLLNAFHSENGFALVYEWVNGEVLSSPDFPGKEGRNRPESSHYRFRQLPLPKITSALTTVYEVHAYLESKGFTAVDFYDGGMIYDFEEDKLHLCDFDCYTKGSFILEKDRLFGSTRFMAPEEFVKGSIIDGVTNVFTMGATAFVFLGEEGSRELKDWKASEELYRIVLKAVSPDRTNRFESIDVFYQEWLKALN